MARPSSSLIAIAAFFSPAPILAQDEGEHASQAQAESPFVGRYDGGSFEMAMGMEIRADGTFGWGLSVGALDMRAKGTWFEEDDVIIFVSDPKPVPPEFGWSGMESTPDGPLVKVVWASNGKPFQYSDVRLTSRNGAQFYEQVQNEGWSPPPEECDAPVSLQLVEGIYDVESPVYNLVNAFPIAPGETIRFEFRANDLGVANFDGVMGKLEAGVLRLQNGRWPMELRKLTPRSNAN